MDIPSEPPASLKLIDNQEGVVQTWKLEGQPTFRLGRAPNCNINLPYSWVSRQHAMIQVEENGVHNIIDLGSSNGTFVNNTRIFTPTALRTGDIIRIGKTELLFVQKNILKDQSPSEPEDFNDRTVAFVQKERVTILVCDIVEFTRLSEIIGDQLISKLLRSWTDQLNTIIRKNKGIVDKFIGDAVLAMWTSPLTPEESTTLALQTVLEVSDFTEKLGKKLLEIPWELKIRAALNTGEAVVGNMGVDGQRDFTVIGNVVNVAFRLESLTKKAGLELIMGEDAANTLCEADKYFVTKKYEIRGKEEQILTYGSSFDQLRHYLSLSSLNND